MKIIAFYLPQFHEVDINNDNYGKGFTEWDTVSAAKPLYKGHIQPTIPLNRYCLTDKCALKWQADLAHKYGIYGWAIYHYWYEGKLVLEKPLKLLLENKDIDINYCLSWANHNWTKSLREKSKEIILEQTYGGEEDWKKHFEFFLPFFRDSRYIRIDNKPVLIIYRPQSIPRFREMVEYWNKCAVEADLTGVVVIQQQKKFLQKKADGTNYNLEYQPTYIRNRVFSIYFLYHLKRVLASILRKIRLVDNYPFSIWNLKYDYIWKKIIKDKPDSTTISGAFVNWDNSPRKKRNAYIIQGYTTEKFKKYLSQKIKKTRSEYTQNDYLFMFAWNEWGEGGYLEPDQIFKLGRLEAVRDALKATNEFPY